MQELYKNYFKKMYPYKSKNYDDKFISLKVIESIHQFCRQHKIIEKIYAKGSIIYGIMIEGSDIDHIRIKVYKPLSLKEKIKLVDELEEHLKKYNISKLQRIRENNYVRVFYDYNELISLPRALTIKDEIYPSIHILTAKDKELFKKKLYRRAYKYCGFVSNDWINKIKERLNLL